MKNTHIVVKERVQDYLADRPVATMKQEKQKKWRKYLQKLAKVLEQVRQTKKFDYLMQRAGIPLTGGEIVAFTLIVGFLAAVFVMLITLRWQWSIISFCIAVILIVLYIKIKITRRLHAFTEQMGDTLLMISDAIRVGFSFMQAIDFVAKEMEAPIGEEFSKVIAETHIGTPLETALNNMAKRVKSDDFDLMVAAVLIQRQVGGNLAYILDTISATIMSRIRMKREVKTLTAQGRLSGVVLALLPIFLAVILYIINPQYLQPLLTTPTGHMAIGGALISELVGFWVIQRIVDIDV
ncbi:tight adherence protein B [Pectinatus brassicae]|uniref:Tight adherence protein B n=2 Tax=Pectinatus brassicae TaxID=862415 RepID=A0A840UQH9_9FIRM|nr:type II secretion system F family protein [Pectinatus brassicae]MBB5335084.1 tight adherence protein B [Pectinatus brassicae]